tara:strand:+ start:415 stop:561 length:147 start_codon:yes stop_codon:yes gene_type:complete
MTNEEIVNLFDTTDITLQRLSMRSGLSVAELKKLLLEAPKQEVWKENR